jgi:hypothetical protein
MHVPRDLTAFYKVPAAGWELDLVYTASARPRRTSPLALRTPRATSVQGADLRGPGCDDREPRRDHHDLPPGYLHGRVAMRAAMGRLTRRSLASDRATCLRPLAGRSRMCRATWAPSPRCRLRAGSPPDLLKDMDETYPGWEEELGDIGESSVRAATAAPRGRNRGKDGEPRRAPGSGPVEPLRGPHP